MKILFAVSNENISEAIIKKYPKEYKEIPSYKNVYYFDAILKEIQRDKSYDRIVISEDLEPFINTNHDSIDNFIFDHLDKISDEAHDNEGKETAIILICSERRSPGSSILNKLFSIGIYNAVMGKDRNLQELCRLINRPRTKKEAKIYYRINQATYDPVVENEVKEAEIQNILTHFKKLGKNTERYADSFNNIAAQYTDEQLKIIVNVLPMKVKAVLERESPKYQSLMGNIAPETNKIQVTKEPGIKINTIGNGTKVSGPIVIPSNVKKATYRNAENTDSNPKTNIANKINKTKSVSVQSATVKPSASSIKNNILEEPVTPVSKTVEVKKVKPIEMNSNELSNEEVAQPEQTEVKRKRGRPPKNPDSKTAVVKPKTGKRGRPPKNPIPVEDDIKDEEILPGIENDILKEENTIEETVDVVDDVSDETEIIEDTLPGLEESEEDILPGISDEIEETTEDILPGVEETDESEEILPGLDDDEDDGSEDVDVSSLLSGLDEDDENIEEDELLPGLEDDTVEEEILSDIDNIDASESDMLPGIEDETEGDDVLPGLDGAISDLDNLDNDLSNMDNQEETILPGMGFEDTTESDEEIPQSSTNSNVIETVKSQIQYTTSNLNSLLSKDKKIVTFIGTTKNGTSFLINNLALTFSLMGIDTAILDMTKNRNSYYIFTNNLEELRKTAHASIGKLENGYADGIKVNKNFTVYTALPDDENTYENAEPILSTLVQNHSLVLVDCDFNTPPAYFASCQEIYLVQSMDILTIQPLTSFIRELKFKNAWEPEKARIVINKEMKVRGLNSKIIIAGMSRYNGPDMSVMTDLFNKDMIKACSIPFDEKVCATYLETMATCKLTLSGYSKQFKQKMEILSEMVYPSLNSKKTYGPMDNNSNFSNYQKNNNVFSNSMNSTLNQMKNKY